MTPSIAHRGGELLAAVGPEGVVALGREVGQLRDQHLPHLTGSAGDQRDAGPRVDVLRHRGAVVDGLVVGVGVDQQQPPVVRLGHAPSLLGSPRVPEPALWVVLRHTRPWRPAPHLVPEPDQERPVRLQPVDVVELVDAEPAHLVVLGRLRLARDQPHQRHRELVAVPDRNRPVQPAGPPRPRSRAPRAPRAPAPRPGSPPARPCHPGTPSGRPRPRGTYAGPRAPARHGGPRPRRPPDAGSRRSSHHLGQAAGYRADMHEQPYGIHLDAGRATGNGRSHTLYGSAGGPVGVAGVVGRDDPPGPAVPAGPGARPGRQRGLRLGRGRRRATRAGGRRASPARADAEPDEHVAGRPLLVTTSYAKVVGGDIGGTSHGCRVTFVDVETLRYEHVLLVEPGVDDDGAPTLAPVHLHAGGIVWHGPWLHLAATARGLVELPGRRHPSRRRPRHRRAARHRGRPGHRVRPPVRAARAVRPARRRRPGPRDVPLLLPRPRPQRGRRPRWSRASTPRATGPGGWCATSSTRTPGSPGSTTTAPPARCRSPTAWTGCRVPSYGGASTW